MFVGQWFMIFFGIVSVGDFMQKDVGLHSAVQADQSED
jgi:hypothetical protein